MTRLHAMLLHYANESHPICRTDCYAMKRRLLERYGTLDGYDVQEIVKRCWGYYDGPPCSGATCRKCGGTGIYRRAWHALTRYRWHGYVFHIWERNPNCLSFTDSTMVVGFDLLMGEYGVAVEIRDTTIAVISRTIDLDYGGVTMRTLAFGQKHQAAEIMLRAWLKLRSCR